MVSVMLYPCMFCVAVSMDLFVLCVACLTVNCLVKQFAICLDVFVILLFNVMVLLEVLYWIDHVWSSIECVYFNRSVLLLGTLY